MSKAANAVLALSRAFYGKRLTSKQYADLLSCKSINEVASYLRTRTVYETAFSGASYASFTGDALENVIERFRMERFVSLCRYELAIGNNFYKYFLVKTEVEQILRCTLLMIGGCSEEYLMNFGDFLDRHLSIDLYALGKADSLEAMADALKKTPYEKIFRKCLSDPERSYLTFELAFDSYFEKFQEDLIKKCFSGKEEQQLKNLYSRMYDVSYIKKQLRIAAYYKNNLAVSSLVGPSSVSMTLFSEKQLRALSACKSESEIRQALLQGPYRDYYTENDGASLEEQTYKGFYNYCKKNIRFSSKPGVVMSCYLFLAQNEVNNIVRIIEGIKYSVSPQEIKKSLVGVGD